MIQMNLQSRNRLIDLANRLVTARTEVEGEGWTGSLGRRKLPPLEQTNKALLYSTGNCMQSPGISRNGKEHKEVYACVWLSHFSVKQKLAQHCKSTILQH